MPINTLIIGASAKPHRYAYKALEALTAAQHHCSLLANRSGEILGIPVFTAFSELQSPIDTVTLYLNATRLEPMLEAIIALKPRRVIFNPGTESTSAQACLRAQGIDCIEDCTLIMLRENRY